MRKGKQNFEKNARLIFVLVISFAFFFIFATPTIVGAVDVGLEPVGEAIGASQTDIRVIVARIINVALGLLAVIALSLTLYGGFLWMTAGGVEERVEKAKKVLTNAAIGLAIILMSWAITYFVFSALLGEGGIFGPGGGPSGPPATYEQFSSALGNGVISYHYPARGATDIPRNTRILVTFKKEMSIESFISGYDDNDTPLDVSDDTASDLLNGANVKIYRTADGEGSALRETGACVRFTDDLKTFVFQPVEWLGSASENVSYTVSLGPNIKDAEGDDAFQGSMSDGYQWNFQVSTFVDLTPPEVRSVFPRASEEYPKNVVIQINFSEPVDPTSATGHTSRFSNLMAEGGGIILGTFSISNEYKTVEFLSDESCGTNSCGGEVFCLPGNADIGVTVKAASMASDEAPAAIFPYNGVVDMAGNSLDGNGNGTAEGPSTDNYLWTFRTTDNVLIEPPSVVSVNPSAGEGVVAPDLPVEIIWDTLMSFSGLNSSNILLGDNQEDEFAIWYSFDSENLTEDGLAAEGELVPHHTLTSMRHGLFLEETEYYPEIFSDVKDVYQNCFSPAATPGCPKDRDGAPWCCDEQPSNSRSTGACQSFPVKQR
ncbi:MAG: Ig-like domain-containing protein [Patescibacteria group bacterium]|nr:Ig-like domain-containing protein [Patescibacteria group bacterium]